MMAGVKYSKCQIWNCYVSFLYNEVYNSIQEQRHPQCEFSCKVLLLYSRKLPVTYGTIYCCAAGFALLNLPKGKSLGRSKPVTSSYAQALATHCVGFLLYPSSSELPYAK